MPGTASSGRRIARSAGERNSTRRFWVWSQPKPRESKTRQMSSEARGCVHGTRLHLGKLEEVAHFDGADLLMRSRRLISIAFYDSRLPIRSAPSLWCRHTAKQRSWKRRSNQEAQI